MITKTSPFKDKNGQQIREWNILKDLGIVQFCTDELGEWGVRIAYDLTWLRLDEMNFNEIEVTGMADSSKEIELL